MLGDAWARALLHACTRRASRIAGATSRETTVLDDGFGRELLWVAWFFLPGYLANMAPVLVGGHLEPLAQPIDAGWTLRGRRILGDHKTWRGIVVGIVAGAATFAAQQLLYDAGLLRGLALVDYETLSPWTGVLLGLGTGVGDAVKSFFKRQVGIAPGSSWPVFDQLDFMVGAYAFVSVVVVPPIWATLALLPTILVGSIVVTTIGWRLGLKESWI
jgi:CDP-2,3-bis-(O-geranylgeranyl)-sn-glycerol synthase